MFDKSKSAGLCVGGPLNGCLIQGDRFYRDGVEVDKDNKPIPGAKQPPKSKPKVDNTDMTAFVDPQVAAQLSGD